MKKALEILNRLESQFCGYALRVACADEGNDTILGTIDELRKELQIQAGKQWVDKITKGRVD